MQKCRQFRRSMPGGVSSGRSDRQSRPVWMVCRHSVHRRSGPAIICHIRLSTCWSYFPVTTMCDPHYLLRCHLRNKALPPLYAQKPMAAPATAGAATTLAAPIPIAVPPNARSRVPAYGVSVARGSPKSHYVNPPSRGFSRMSKERRSRSLAASPPTPPGWRSR